MVIANAQLFPNDFPALLPDPSPPPPSPPAGPASDLFQIQPVRGRCSVLCFHPNHGLTLSRMPLPAVLAVVKKWAEVYESELKFLTDTGAQEGYVQIFENRGAMMGASAPHPHGQVWTLDYVPDEVATELFHFRKYAETHAAHPIEGPTEGGQKGCCNGGTCAEVPAGQTPNRDGKACLLCTYAAAEYRDQSRIVVQNEHWLALVPFWAVWPYETLVLPYRRHIPTLSQMTEAESTSLAEVLQALLVRYDGLFSCPFPYSMGVHQSPLSDSEGLSHVHFHFYPPLLRSATVRKFLVGFEMLGEVQRDLSPEQAAEKLRAVSATHYFDQ